MSKFLNGTGITYLWKQVVNFIKTYCASNDDLDRIKYYGDKDIVPSDESYFTVSSDGTTITGLTDEGKTQTSLVIPYKINGVEVTRVEGSAFLGCSSITSLIIPNSIISFGISAFQSCTSLTSIKVPNSVRYSDSAAFSGCTSLKTINISNGVTDIAGGTFSGCTSLVAIEIPNGIKYIENLAFNNCTSLKSIKISNSVTSIAEDAFNGCTNLTIYCEQGSYADTYAKGKNIPIVYTDVKDIATETELERLKYYGDKDIIPSPERYFTVSGNTLTGLTDTGKMNLSSNVVIPYKINGTLITSIGTGAFKNYESTIDSITLPSSIIAIEAEAFYGCTFTTIEIPSSVESIGDSAFARSLLLSVTILNYNNILLDYSNIFSGCSSALKIYCEQGSNAETFAKNNNIPVVYLSVKGKVTTITVPTTGWTTSTDTNGTTYYTKNITNSTLTSTGYPITDVVLPDDIAAARLQDEAYKCIGKITINDGSVTLCCFDEIPSVSFTMRIQIMYI